MKLLKGEPNKDRINEAEPKPPEGEVVRPETLSAAAVVVWARIAPVALAMGTLTPADVWAFGTLCELQATLDAAAAEKGSMDLSGAWVGIELKYAALIRPYYEKFGLEPAGRGRIKVKPQEQARSKWEGLVG